jgi:hypothetical protein
MEPQRIQNLTGDRAKSTTLQEIKPKRIQNLTGDRVEGVTVVHQFSMAYIDQITDNRIASLPQKNSELFNQQDSTLILYIRGMSLGKTKTSRFT